MTATAVAVKIDTEAKERLKNLAEAKQRSVHWLMCEAINQYIEREEKRASFRQDAMNAWEEYQETGLHVTGDEVIDWLKTWGTNNEKNAPKCHQ
ncbi:MAG: ribbon-helix-helix protein, CopG family [Deltaproteobacteria bacterium]|nr:ribbon-helix-helix protein, CopG family [Deltaproteobacteria bacterium]